MSDDVIKAVSLAKTYGKKDILRNINLVLEPGKVNALLGPSGAGKTTLCRNLALLEMPSSGTIEMFGRRYIFPTKEKHLDVPYPLVNFVYQQLFLWPHLTNAQNILLAFDDVTDEISQKLDAYAELFGISEILEQYPNQSSIGQKQRVAITRALILNPRYIFLDEITSALDNIQVNNIKDIVRKLKSEGVGVLLVSHNLNFIQDVADCVHFMESGTILETGTPAIFAAPVTKELERFLNG